MTFQGGEQDIRPKIIIRTMRDDLKSLGPEKASLKTISVKTAQHAQQEKKASPPEELPIAPIIQEPQIKIIEKPIIKEVIKEVRVPVETIKIVEKPVIKEVIKEIKVPVEKIIEKPIIREKIVEKPVVREKVIEKKVFVNKSRPLKQVIIILILVVILAIIGLGAYYLVKTPGQEIIVKPEPEPIASQPEPEPEPQPQAGLLPPVEKIIQTKAEKPLNLPPGLKFDDYNLLIFSDNKMGLVFSINNVLNTLAELTLWEKSMPKDLSWLFQTGKIPNALFKVNNWEYPNIVIRYQNTADLANSLHYTVIHNKLIITTSDQDIRLIINLLLQNES